MGSEEDRAWKIYLTLNVMNYKYLQSMESNYIWEKHNAKPRKIVYLKDASKFGMIFLERLLGNTEYWYFNFTAPYYFKI